jgi:hypothetical protein
VADGVEIGDGDEVVMLRFVLVEDMAEMAGLFWRGIQAFTYTIVGFCKSDSFLHLLF